MTNPRPIPTARHDYSEPLPETTKLPANGDTLENARTLALHYQDAAAKCGQCAMRMRFALLMLREFGGMGNGWHGNVAYTVLEWIDEGMAEPLPWPGGAAFEKWAAERGWSNVDGCVGFRLTMKLEGATLNAQ
jgi:hypothetical protein